MTLPANRAADSTRRSTRREHTRRRPPNHAVHPRSGRVPWDVVRHVGVVGPHRVRAQPRPAVFAVNHCSNASARVGGEETPPASGSLVPGRGRGRRSRRSGRSDDRRRDVQIAHGVHGGAHVRADVVFGHLFGCRYGPGWSNPTFKQGPQPRGVRCDDPYAADQISLGACGSWSLGMLIAAQYGVSYLQNTHPTPNTSPSSSVLPLASLIASTICTTTSAYSSAVDAETAWSGSCAIRFLK